MAISTVPDGEFKPVFNEFYGTDAERTARDRARQELEERRSRHRAEQPRVPLTEREVAAALSDLGIEL